MKKPVLLALMAALLSGPAFSQLPDNSIAPDWTGTDLNGNSHHLYAYLDSGYTVFLDVSATWCQPCWNYHNSHAFANLYNQYGPGTTENKVRLFMIEGDPTTTVQDLYQATSNSWGNWVAGTPYPIIDDANIADDLDIGYFPTIYKICPNRIITEVGQLTTSQLWNSVSSCKNAEHPTDAALLPLVDKLRGCANRPMDLVTRIQNMGTEPLTSATIEVRRAGNVLGTVDWTGNLPTYGVDFVNVASYTPTGNTQVTFQITSADDNASNNTKSELVLASTYVANSTQVTFELQTDNYGNETTWKLFKPDGSIYADGGPYPSGAGQPLHTYTWNLEDGNCYRLEVYDQYGDGFCCSYGQGYYKVKVGNQVIFQGGQFGSQDTKFFGVEDASAGVTENTLTSSLNVYPNPTSGLVELEYNMDLGHTVNATVTDMVGKVVMRRTLQPTGGIQHETIDLGNLDNGVYILRLEANGQQATRTITLNK